VRTVQSGLAWARAVRRVEDAFFHQRIAPLVDG
jgi:hypothetical protein